MAPMIMNYIASISAVFYFIQNMLIDFTRAIYSKLNEEVLVIPREWSVENLQV